MIDFCLFRKIQSRMFSLYFIVSKQVNNNADNIKTGLGKIGL